MNNFKLSLQSLDGESYLRCHQVVVDNKLGAEPRITFMQERVAEVAGQVMHMPLPPVTLEFDPDATITLINPATGEPTGSTITQAEAHALLYSAYVAAVNPEPTEEE